MPSAKPTRPQQRQQLSTGTLMAATPDSISRHLGDLATAVQAGEKHATDRSSGNTDLIVGANRINHGLGRAPRGATVTPTTADASFAWALTGGDAKQAVITVIGVPQPGAYVEIF